LADIGGSRQLLWTAGDRCLGLDPVTGEALWSFPWEVSYDNNIAQPLRLRGDRIFLSAGYGKGCAVFAITQTGEGWSEEEVWSNRHLKNKFTSSVFWDGHVYGLDESILTCLNASTGERAWKDGRYGYGQLLLAEGHLIILSGTGELALVEALPERFVEVARIQAIEGKTWNHPAMAGGILLVRNSVEMAAFDLRAVP
jgi:outer membrane protein assembly factor BamB